MFHIDLTAALYLLYNICQCLYLHLWVLFSRYCDVIQRTMGKIRISLANLLLITKHFRWQLWLTCPLIMSQNSMQGCETDDVIAVPLWNMQSKLDSNLNEHTINPYPPKSCLTDKFWMGLNMLMSLKYNADMHIVLLTQISATGLSAKWCTCVYTLNSILTSFTQCFLKNILIHRFSHLIDREILIWWFKTFIQCMPLKRLWRRLSLTASFHPF